jgi:soluble lytic murein transglycosylase
MRRRRWMLLLVAFLAVDAALILWWRHARRERQYDKEIFAAARRYGVHPALIKAVVWRESKYDAGARGRAGELGLMQIREPAAREWAEAEKLTLFWHGRLADPALNTQCGAWYLRKLLLRYRHTDAPMTYALADYNAGRTQVLRWAKGGAATNSTAFLAQMDYPGTRAYVEAVTERFTHYRPIVELQAAER